MNRYPYEDHVLPIMSAESNPEPGRQWSRDNGNHSGMRWHTYDNLPTDENIYEMHHQMPQHHRQPGQSPQSPGFPRHFQRGQGMGMSMHHPNQQRFTDDAATAVALPYLGPGPMPRPIYPSDVQFDMYAQPPVLRQLYPSNEQTCSLANVQSGMRHDIAAQGGVGSSLQTCVTPLANLGRTASHMRHLTAERHPSSVSMMTRERGIAQPPSENSLQSTVKTNTAALAMRHRLESKNATSPVPSEESKRRRTDKTKSDFYQPEEKEVLATDTSKDKSSNKYEVGTRFITATVPDVLRWKTHNIFSHEERVPLLVEIVGTVFDIGGDIPVRISVYSQNSEMVGIFWETDRRLNRVAIQPGTLVRVVLRIPPKERNEFHFLSVCPLKALVGIESHYRRFAYICLKAIGKQTQVKKETQHKDGKPI